MCCCCWPADRLAAGYSSGAAWQDLKLGVEHLTRWKKVALVTDVEWMSHLTDVFGWMTPGEMRRFPLEEQPDACQIEEHKPWGIKRGHRGRTDERGVEGRCPLKVLDPLRHLDKGRSGHLSASRPSRTTASDRTRISRSTSRSTADRRVK